MLDIYAIDSIWVVRFLAFMLLIDLVLLFVSGECPLEVVAGTPKLFMLGNKTMDCAPGTTSNLTLCTCVRSVPS